MGFLTFFFCIACAGVIIGTYCGQEVAMQKLNRELEEIRTRN